MNFVDENFLKTESGMVSRDLPEESKLSNQGFRRILIACLLRTPYGAKYILSTIPSVPRIEVDFTNSKSNQHPKFLSSFLMPATVLLRSAHEATKIF